MSWLVPTIQADVVIVGAGLAGLSALLGLDERRVVVLCPSSDRGSSALAQGGIAAALQDDVEEHIRDTCAVAAGHADSRRVQALVKEGRALVQELVDAGLPFDRTVDGDLAFGLEAGHSRARILHADGDATGAAVVRFLVASARRRQNVRRVVGTAAQLVRDASGRIAGVVFEAGDGELGLIEAPHVVLATGGIGALFEQTTNSSTACGDGLALAVEAGAGLVDMEFVQFHPTALDVALRPLPLVTEALRGAGALLVNGRGERLMHGVHPLLELAPRDIVARTVWSRQQLGEHVYLNARGVRDLSEHFPSLTTTCLELGIPLERIPITPAAHFHMGGIEVDDDGTTGVEGLWACGEVACTGVHGANRLASNSMLEALVFGTRVGHALAESETGARGMIRCVKPTIHPVDQELNAHLATVLSTALGVERDRAAMQFALGWFEAAGERENSLVGARRLRVARLLANAALHRRESRGAHFRRDYPMPTDEFQYRLRLQLRGDDVSVSGAPLTRYSQRDRQPGSNQPKHVRVREL